MEKKLTRKDFLATAAAVGAAAIFVPKGSASAETAEPSEAVAQLGRLDLEVEQGAASLEGTSWEPQPAGQVDIVKSYNGLHTMNAEGRWTFTGWDPVHDQPTDQGFGFDASNNNGTFLIVSSQVEIAAAGKYGTLSDWVAESGANGIWRYQKWAGGKLECWGRTGSIPVDVTDSHLGMYYKSVANVATFPSGWFLEKPAIFVNYSLSTNGLVYNVNTWDAHTDKNRISITVLAGASQPGLGVYCDFHCIGRWS